MILILLVLFIPLACVYGIYAGWIAPASFETGKTAEWFAISFIVFPILLGILFVSLLLMAISYRRK